MSPVSQSHPPPRVGAPRALPGPDQTLELADADPKTLGAFLLAQTVLDSLTNHMRSLKFRNTHRQKPLRRAPLLNESAW